MGSWFRTRAAQGLGLGTFRVLDSGPQGLGLELDEFMTRPGLSVCRLLSLFILLLECLFFDLKKALFLYLCWQGVEPCNSKVKVLHLCVHMCVCVWGGGGPEREIFLGHGCVRGAVDGHIV